jgi:PAS domain S-box-containing protein
VTDALLEDIFPGVGEMAGLMRAFDWDGHALGPPSAWPDSLKVALRLLLTSRFEMWLGWGREISFFYNDAYRPTLGDKHPRALGAPTADLWAEIWDDIKERLEAVYDRGESTWDRALLLLLNRHGYPEETYHTFSYSPLFGDGGVVEGVFCAVSEETERVISGRRLATLNALAGRLAPTDCRTGVMAAVEAVLGENRKDLPFALVYLFDDDGAASLAATVGARRGGALAPLALGVGGALDLKEVFTAKATALRTLDPSLEPPKGDWSVPPSTAALAPIVGQGGERPLGVLVAGLNPHRRADADYLGFLQLIAGQIASSLASAEVAEAERRRAAELATVARLRHEAADALKAANARLRTEVRTRTLERDRLTALFRQAPSFMCLLQGEAHVFELVNEAYEQLVGRTDLVGRSVREALPELHGQGFFELLDRVYARTEVFAGRNLPVTIRRAPGAALEERYVTLIYQPVVGDGGRAVGIFVNGFDVTDQKRTEDELQGLNQTLEQRVAQRTLELENALDRLRREEEERRAAELALRQAQKIEALGQLTGGVAHDFNNLLQVVSGNLALLSKDVAGNLRAETRVQNALAGVARGAKLASQLLAFGRRQALEPKVVNLGRFIANMDDMLRRALGEEIELQTIVSGGLWNTLVDPSQIENAILNLAINARDAMHGHGRLTIEASNAVLDHRYALAAAEDLKPGPYVMIAVTDTGCGMTPETLERALEPFFTTKPEGRGTGLGLSMVYGLVKQSLGHLKIYSELNVGTTVKLYLPQAPAPEDRLEENPEEPAEGGVETILVVEDDEDVRETTVALLRELGYRVLKARDAASALTVIESGAHIDLLFTDVVMPGPLRSPDLVRRVKERSPRIGVLFTSGYAENAIVHGGRLDPGVELLSKPYSREALARKVRHVLAARPPAPAVSEPRRPPSPEPATAQD